LDKEGPLPDALWISRICQEFPCYGPEEAERAWRRAPVGWLEEIIEARHYAEAKALYERTARPEDLPKDDPMITLVEEIRYQREGERLAASRARKGPRG